MRGDEDIKELDIFEKKRDKEKEYQENIVVILPCY